MSYRTLFFLVLLGLASCKERQLPNQEMIDLLKVSARVDHNHENVFSPEAMIEYCDSIVTCYCLHVGIVLTINMVWKVLKHGWKVQNIEWKVSNFNGKVGN